MKKSLERTPTSIKIESELWEKVQVACIQQKMTQSEAIEALLRRWLGEESKPVPAPFPDLTKDEERILRAVLRFWREAPDNDTFRGMIVPLVKEWAAPKKS